MPCKFCGERDESKLIMSSRFVNGIVETVDICFKCYWRDKFEAEAKGDMNGILSEGETVGRIESVGSINPLGLQERV